MWINQGELFKKMKKIENQRITKNNLATRIKPRENRKNPIWTT
jgi:hypothetical protein